MESVKRKVLRERKKKIAIGLGIVIIIIAGVLAFYCGPVQIRSLLRSSSMSSKSNAATLLLTGAYPVLQIFETLKVPSLMADAVIVFVL